MNQWLDSYICIRISDWTPICKSGLKYSNARYKTPPKIMAALGGPTPYTLSLEPFKIKWCRFYYNVRKISVMKCNYKFLANLYQIFFVKYANNYCIIGDVTCINMHHLTADDKALILTLQVEKHCNVDKMILEFPNNSWKDKHCITWCENLIKL